jgi:F420-dependent hydroxymycolic acid dehydrogenase
MTDRASDTRPERAEEAPLTLDRRSALKAAALLGAAAVAGGVPAVAQAAPTAAVAPLAPRKGQVGFVLSHEQFTVPQLVQLGRAAERAGFDTLWTSDHFQPWMENQGHVGHAWVTLGALGQQATRIPFGTGVTCPTFRNNPAQVAEAFATLGTLYPSRVFLGVGSGEALNEQTATGRWAPWQERADRLQEAVEVIRKLWSGQTVDHQGQYYQVQRARIYDVPNPAVPIYVASNGKKSMYKAAQYADAIITDPKSLMDPAIRAQFEAGARAAGRDPAAIPILVEAFVVVGNQADAELAAAYWRFIPKAWTSLVNEPDPVRILHRSEVEIPLEEVYKDWPISTDPNVHVQALQKLFDAGATQVYVHSGQPNQQRVIDFYGRQVLPRLRRARR